MNRTRCLGASLVFLLLAAGPAGADVESDLRARLRGAAAILRAPAFSACIDHYTDNVVAGGRITSRETRRLPAGELVRIDNIHVGWTRFDVNLSFSEPLRITWQEGPFEVHDQRHCKIQLKFDVPREARRSAAAAEAVIREVLEVHGDPDSARSSATWNQRVVEPYPEGWEKRREEWMAWKSEQRNREIRGKTESVLAEAARIMSYLPSDDDYLASFGAGARARSDTWSSCDAMLTASFYTSGSGGKSSRGYSDGQYVAWASHLVRALQQCWLEPGR